MSDEVRQAGRPRDAAAAAALKAAALGLIRARGYRQVSIAAIAEEAGVARQTLYNRWATKADLVLAAVFDEVERHDGAARTAGPASAAARLEQLLAAIFRHLEQDGDTLRALIAAAQEDDAFRRAFRDRFVAPREAVVTALLEEARDRGELPADSDVVTLSEMIHGAFWYRLLNGLPLDAALARALTAVVFGPSGGPPDSPADGPADGAAA